MACGDRGDPRFTPRNRRRPATYDITGKGHRIISINGDLYLVIWSPYCAQFVTFVGCCESPRSWYIYNAWLLVSKCSKYDLHVHPIWDNEHSWLSWFQQISQMLQELQAGISQNAVPSMNINLSHRWVMGVRSPKFGIIRFDPSPCLLVSSALCFCCDGDFALCRMHTVHRAPRYVTRLKSRRP